LSQQNSDEQQNCGENDPRLYLENHVIRVTVELNNSQHGDFPGEVYRPETRIHHSGVDKETVGSHLDRTPEKFGVRRPSPKGEVPAHSEMFSSATATKTLRKPLIVGMAIENSRRTGLEKS
jgi:hypothetical protein